MFTFKTSLPPLPGGLVSSVVVAGGAVTAATLFSLSLFAPHYAHVLQMAGLLSAAIALYATGVIPGFLTSLLVLLIAVVGDLAPLPVVFSGFASGGVWLLLAGIIIGLAANETELGRFVASRLNANLRLTYVSAVLLLTSASALLGFLVPAAIPRIILLMPLVTGIAAALGYERGSRGYCGLAIAVAAGSFYPTLSIMTATLPGIIFVGSAEATFGVSPSYAQFLLYQFPIVGVLRWAFLVILLVVFFQEPPSQGKKIDDHIEMTSAQRRLLIILCGLLALWMTDAIHHIAPAWVALGAALLVLAPGIGVLPHRTFAKQADLTPLIYVAGLISLGAVVSHSGLGDFIGSLVTEHYPSGGSAFWNYLLISWLSGLVCLLVTAPAAPTLLVPLAHQLSDISGLSLTATMMTQFVGLSTIVLPYQAPPLVVAIGLFGISSVNIARITVFLFLLTSLIILPLNFLWWQAISLVP